MVDATKEAWGEIPIHNKRLILRAIAAELMTLNQATELIAFYSGMTLWRAARDGELYTVKIGHTQYCTVTDLQQWYNSKRPQNNRNLAGEFEGWPE